MDTTNESKKPNFLKFFSRIKNVGIVKRLIITFSIICPKNKIKAILSERASKNFPLDEQKTQITIEPKIYAPISYWDLSLDEKNKICNGCGAKNGLKVPGTFYGLDIEEACNIHDYMYSTGKTSYDKLFADAMFRLNLSVLIDSKNTLLDKFLSLFRHHRAGTYYIAVAKYGNDAFWVDKERLPIDHPDAFRITFTGEFRNLKDIENKEMSEIINKLEKINSFKQNS